MSQHDYNIANGTGAAVRSDINLALTAIATANSGTSAPTTTYAYQLWADTTSGNLKIRNGGDSAWIVVGALAGHVYTSVVSTNPASLLAGMSGTTWVAFGSGKTLVGLDSGDADFNSIEETGGSKTDTTAVGGTSLSIAQLPPHGHPYAVTSTSTPVSGSSGGFMTSSYQGSSGPM